VTCVHCESETYFNGLTDTIFGQHRFELEELFYMVNEMRSEPSRFAAAASERNTSNGNILGDATASPLPATLSQRQL